MTTLEIILSVFGAITTLLGGMAWIGTVLIKRIEAKNTLELKSLDKEENKVGSLKSSLAKQNETIRNQNDTIVILRQQINEMQVKIGIIVPMLRRVLKDDPDNLEILDHLETFGSGATNSAGHKK